MPGGHVSSGPEFGQARDDGGDRVDPRDPALPMSSQKPVRWKRSSSTRHEPATRVESNPTTSALMWKSGSGLKPRSLGVSAVVGDHAHARCAAASWCRRTTLGGPVVPDEERTTPPERRRGAGASIRSTGIGAADGVAASELDPASDAATGPRAGRRGPHGPRSRQRLRPLGPVVGRGRIQRRHPQAGGQGADEGRARSGSATTRPRWRPGSERPLAKHAPPALQNAEAQHGRSRASST